MAEKEGNAGSQKQDPVVPKGDDIMVTNLLIVRDQQESRKFYEEILGAKVVRPADPVVLQFFNAWLVLSPGGEPTEDKPGVIAAAPEPNGPLNSALDLRVNDVWATYELWKSRGAKFLTEPKTREAEIRCYLTDPDGRYIELAQALQG